MNQTKTIATAVLSTAMLATTAKAALAQDETTDDIVAPVPVTGTGSDITSSCELANSLGPVSDASFLDASCDVELSMSDPRLEGDVLRDTGRVFLDFDELGELGWDEGDGPIVAYSSYLIQNDGGVWRERPRPAIWMRDSDDTAYPLEAVATMVLDGEEGYEGLVAVLERTADTSTAQTYRGVIMDARLMPSVPEGIAAE